MFNPFSKQDWIDFDVWVNVKLFRGQDETISDRLGENLLEGKYGFLGWRLNLCQILSWIDPSKGNHCIEAIEEIE
jgi:hypothetical protein